MSRPWTSEHQAIALQLVVEIDRCMDIADKELKAARFADARDSLAVARKLLPLLEELIQAKPKEEA